MSQDLDEYEASPVSPNQVHDMCKEITPEDVRVKKDGSEYLSKHMLLILEALIETAEEERVEKK